MNPIVAEGAHGYRAWEGGTGFEEAELSQERLIFMYNKLKTLTKINI
jgi:hypothetical protein